MGAQGKYKSDFHRGLGGTPPKNLEILHALKCVLRASEAPFHACIQYIHTCRLPSSFSGSRSKSMTYRALAAAAKRSRKIQCVFNMKFASAA